MASESSGRDDLHLLFIIMSSVLFLILAIHWFYFPLGQTINSSVLHDTILLFFNKIVMDKSIVLRFLFLFSIGSFFYIKSANIKIKEEDIFTIRLLYIFNAAVFLIGYINFSIYDIYIYPIVLILILKSSSLFFSTFKVKLEDENIFGISNEEPMKLLSYSYETVDDKILTVHSGEQHTMVTGGSGAGKSDSILKPTILQHIELGYPALIYDAKPELPLTQTVYTCYSKLMEEGYEIEVPLKVFNISNHKQSFRINVLDKMYLHEDDSAKLTELITSFLTNFKDEWRGDNAKRDHWFEAARTIWIAVAKRFLVDDKIRSKLSLPMIWELVMTHKVGALINFIEEKEESSRILTPLKMSSMGNMKQFTSEFTSAMSGLSLVIGDRYVYWLLSASEIDLKVNVKGSETLLCIGGNNASPETHTPIIATIITLIMSFFRIPNQVPTLFQLDEIYTIYLEHLPKDANLFRSNGISMQVGVQLKSMLDDVYGKNKANNIFGACGNQFYGMNNDIGTSEYLEKMLSDVEKVSTSYTDSDNNNSQSSSLKNKKAKNIRDLNSQKAGEFTGKIANGVPPYFEAKFKRYRYFKDEIPLPNFAEDAYGNPEDLEKEIVKNCQSIVNFASEILDSYPNELEKHEQ